MSRKHFQAIAAILEAFRTRMEEGDHWELVDSIADVCQWSNPRFDRGQFRFASGADACRPKSEALRSA